MSAGLFGKLPAKRDFIGMNASRRFLEAWEPWLQAGVAMSKQMLGDAWIETYNRAPIWRYWLGADICGEAMIGAFMPSVDGVGRSFPLAIFVGEGDASLPRPNSSRTTPGSRRLRRFFSTRSNPERRWSGSPRKSRPCPRRRLNRE